MRDGNQARPGDFPIGSLESRAAARAQLDAHPYDIVAMETGDLPRAFGPQLDRKELLRDYEDRGDHYVKEEIRTLESGRRCLYRDTVYKDSDQYRRIMQEWEKHQCCE
jgi:hypothetical protein